VCKGKKRKDYAFRRQFNEKPSIIPGCPDCVQRHRLTQRGQGDKLCKHSTHGAICASIMRVTIGMRNAVVKPCWVMIPERHSHLSAGVAHLCVRAWNTESMMGAYLAAGWKANLCSSSGALLACKHNHSTLTDR